MLVRNDVHSGRDDGEGTFQPASCVVVEARVRDTRADNSTSSAFHILKSYATMRINPGTGLIELAHGVDVPIGLPEEEAVDQSAERGE